MKLAGLRPFIRAETLTLRRRHLCRDLEAVQQCVPRGGGGRPELE